MKAVGWLASPWFPAVFAVAQTLRFVAMIAYDYWDVQRHETTFHALTYIKTDLAKPLFEPREVCLEFPYIWLTQAVDLPAYMAATLTHALVNWGETCGDELTFPRGQIVTAAFVAPLWWLVGASVRRMAQRRWRPQTSPGVKRVLLMTGFLGGLAGVGVTAVGAGMALDEPDTALRATGLAFWLLYITVLCAERLRLGPFAKVSNSGAISADVV